MKDAHAVGTAQDLVSLFVVAKADVGGGDEQIKRVILVDVQVSVLSLFLWGKRKGEEG